VRFIESDIFFVGYFEFLFFYSYLSVYGMRLTLTGIISHTYESL